MLQQASSAAGEPPFASSSSVAAATVATSPAAASVMVESCPALRRHLAIRGGSSLFGSRSKEAEQNSGTQSAARRRKMGLVRKSSKARCESANTNTSKQQEETTTTSTRYPQWHSAVAGAAAGAGSRLLTAPLDLLRIRRQLQLDHPPASPISSAAFTDAVQSAASKPIGAASANAARSRPGGLAGLLGRFPLLSSLAQIAREEGGYRSLYRGNVAATYLWITYAAVQFSLYSRTSDFLTSFAVAHAVPPSPPPSLPIRNNGSGGGNDVEAPFPLPGPIRHALSGIASSPTSVAFVAGASAGLAATLTTYPFDLCRTTFAARGIGGAADAVGRSNLRTLETGLEAAPVPSLLLRCAYHHFRVASRTDGVYRINGLLAVPPPAVGATASKIGDEIDLLLEWTPRSDWLVEAGFGLFFAVPYLEQALEEPPRRDILYLSIEWSL